MTFGNRRYRVWPVCLLLAAAAAAAYAAPAPITVQLDWKPTAQFAGILVAREKGFYAKEGLDVTIVPASGEMATVPIVAASPNSIGVTEADVLLVEAAKGARVKAFATMMQTTPFSLFTLKASGLTTIKSLKGKRIGLYGDGQKAIDVLLKFNGMTRRDVTLVSIPYSVDALIEGGVDAMQGYVVDEAVRLEMEHHPINVISMSENGYTSYAEVLFASNDLVEKHPERLVAFLRATEAGWKFAAAHPDETAAMIVATYQRDGSVGEQKQSLLKTLPLLHAESQRFGAMQPESWARCIAMFNQYQLVDRHVSAEHLVDYSILDKLYGQ